MPLDTRLKRIQKEAHTNGGNGGLTLRCGLKFPDSITLPVLILTLALTSPGKKKFLLAPHSRGGDRHHFDPPVRRGFHYDPTSFRLEIFWSFKLDPFLCSLVH